VLPKAALDDLSDNPVVVNGQGECRSDFQRIRGWLQACNFMCDFRCDLVYLRFTVRQESSSIFCTCSKSHTKSHLQHQIAATTPNPSCDAKPNSICHLACNFVYVSQLKRHQIAHGIAHKITWYGRSRYNQKTK
jgi:hypothetical protein